MSGISGDRAYRIQSKMKGRLADIISSALITHPTHMQIIERSRERVWNDPDMKKIPSYVRSYLMGYWDANMEEINRRHIVWMLWLDDRLRLRAEVDALTTIEKNAGFTTATGTMLHVVDNNYKSPWQRIDNDKSRYVWKDAHGVPLIDKPF